MFTVFVYIICGYNILLHKVIVTMSSSFSIITTFVSEMHF